VERFQQKVTKQNDTLFPEFRDEFRNILKVCPF